MPLSKLVLWSIRTTVCPEAYIDLQVEPGKEVSWRIAYEFYNAQTSTPVTAARRKAGDRTMYVGTYTRGPSKGIYAYRFDSATGKTTPIGLVAETENPSFLAIHPNQRFLYAANEISMYEGQAAGSVSAFAIDPATHALKLLNRVSSRGRDRVISRSTRPVSGCSLRITTAAAWLRFRFTKTDLWAKRPHFSSTRDRA